jgi:predicted RNA-binding protein YlqC (UPF0109 family)
MKDFIAFVVKHLVDKPEEVVVEEVDGHHITVYELRVGRGDMGKVIGRGGQTATALRIIISAASAKCGKRAVLEIVG